jgi:hypothetical protein
LSGEHGQDLADLAAADKGDFLSHVCVSFFWDSLATQGLT